MSDERERLNDKRELLKLKQGIIEESDIIPEKYVIPKAEGWGKVTNFFYHNKLYIIFITFLVLALGYMVFDVVTKEKIDLRVVAFTGTSEHGIYFKTTNIEKAMEKYSPDFDGNGKIKVQLIEISLEQTNNMEMTSVNQTKFVGELATGESQLFLIDKAAMEIINELTEDGGFFVDLKEKYGDQFIGENPLGFEIKGTEFSQLARWQSVSPDMYFAVRSDYEGLRTDLEKAEVTRNQAFEFLENVMNNRKINE